MVKLMRAVLMAIRQWMVSRSCGYSSESTKPRDCRYGTRDGFGVVAFQKFRTLRCSLLNLASRIPRRGTSRQAASVPDPDWLPRA